MARLCAIACFSAQGDLVFVRSRYAGWFGECVLAHRQEAWITLSKKAYTNHPLTGSCLQSALTLRVPLSMGINTAYWLSRLQDSYTLGEL